jgi:2-hydroxychromene-2-carboxylate isomerase
VVQDDAAAGPRWVERVYRARWQEGLDICDPEVVARLAEEAGFDPDRLAGAADDKTIREKGLEALANICREGVFGVPYFVHRFERFWGLDRLQALLASLPLQEAASDDERVPEMSVVGLARATDWGHAGGCG